MSIRVLNPSVLQNLPDPQLDVKWDAILPTIGGYTPLPEDIDLELPTINTDTIPLGSREKVTVGFEKSVRFSMTLYCDLSMAVYSWLDKWKQLVRNRETHVYGFPSEFQKKIVIYLYGVYGLVPVYRVDLYNVTPLGGEKLKLRSSIKPERIKLTANFSADTVKVSPIMAGQIASNLLGGSLLSTAIDQGIMGAITGLL